MPSLKGKKKKKKSFRRSIARSGQITFFIYSCVSTSNFHQLLIFCTSIFHRRFCSLLTTRKVYLQTFQGIDNYQKNESILKKSVSFGNFIEFAIECHKLHHSRSSCLEMTNKRKSSPQIETGEKFSFRFPLFPVAKHKYTIFCLELIFYEFLFCLYYAQSQS